MGTYYVRVLIELFNSSIPSVFLCSLPCIGVDVVKPAAIYMNTTTIGSSKSAKSPSKLSSVSRSGSNASSPKRSGSGIPRPSSAALSPNSESSYEEYDEMVDQFDATRLNVRSRGVLWSGGAVEWEWRCCGMGVGVLWNGNGGAMD